ncbi:type III-A CRISPR-associated protein Cas10/Csm1 [Methanocaldococcus fervens]|uniref:CRISPR system single-strand-specific deoxyribonuclease Cas10/Csm1 (subtype III-A) n=1 Tax=Methanocaldococcus fervens (strain DSM 4213 / JCM 15782 / AG86) TaxID=573064 RepID=C7P8A7_METFA|nr:type III-A CRISPR-associated protein Cas10/Csm1 [Methanocaldococcus fervens]ACV24789.1 CRISPR-associated protein, Csm1 family [Methanocaldococcus fervens AG86]
MTNMEYEALKVGALLHDIGKFLQRVETPNIKELSKESKAKYGNTKHQSLGALFIEKNYKKFGIKDDIKDLVVKLIKEHHSNKKEGLVGILRLADWLSSAERENVEEWDNTIKKEEQRLLSIFELIRLDWYELKEDEKKKIMSKKDKIYGNGQKYDLKPLAINEHTIFPYNKPNHDYNSLYEKFENELNSINIDSFEKLFQLVQKYFWCIPSVTNWKKYGGYLPDISLFDHLKTTCAIACCLYNIYDGNKNRKEYVDAHLTDEKLKKLLEKGLPLNEKGIYDKNNYPYWDSEECKFFSLIHGDISGIQKFIFKIASKYATKSLKGKSFYLDFLTEITAKYICRELGLPITNILFYGGGHFYILSYKIKDDTIDKFEKEINDALFNMFGTDLYITIAKVDIKPSEFLAQEISNFSRKWKEVADKTIEKKLKKFGYKLKEDEGFKKLFEIRGRGVGDRCRICRKELKEKEKIKLYEEEIYVCPNCYSFKELTDFLKKYGHNEKINFNLLKKSSTSLKSEEKPKDIPIYEIPVIEKLFKELNIEFDGEYFSTQYNLPKGKNGELEIPYKIWSIAFPLNNDGGIKDADTLAEQAMKRTGTNKIAILKMDVDNLGQIFTDGLGEMASISRLSTLSSMLTLFFTGYIPYLIKTGKAEKVFDERGNPVEYREEVYLVYSGGDDTLIFGTWDVVWDLAKRIRKDFKRFVCYNPDITLSAGIVIVNPKFEFKKAVNIAEEELESGKSHKLIINELELEKNALTIFDCPMNWDIEVLYDKDCWEKLKDKYKELEKLEKLVEDFNEDKLEKCFEKAIEKTERKRILHIAQIVGERLENVIKKDKDGSLIINLPYYWRIIYYIHKNYSDKDKPYVQFLEDYMKKKVKRSFSSQIKLSYNDLKVSAKIVELKNRKG